MRQCEWVVYAKRPFAGPQAVLAYLSRYTHRVAISNSRLVAMDERGVSFRWKDYRAKGRSRHKTMTLAPQEFMRRFLLHVAVQQAATPSDDEQADTAINSSQATAPVYVCRRCGRALIILQSFRRGQAIRAPPTS